MKAKNENAAPVKLFLDFANGVKVETDAEAFGGDGGLCFNTVGDETLGDIVANAFNNDNIKSWEINLNLYDDKKGEIVGYTPDGDMAVLGTFKMDIKAGIPPITVYSNERLYIKGDKQ